MREKKALVDNPRLIFVYRLITLVLAVFGIGVLFYCYGVDTELVYFTNQSNLAVATMFLVLVVGDVVYKARGREGNFHIHPIVETALMLYISVTFLGYWCLLSWQNFDMSGGVEVTALRNFMTTAGNYIVHGFVPISAIVHWILFVPHERTRYTQSLWFLPYPILYLVFVLIRARVGGPIYADVYYPYPFLDLDALGVGYFVLIVIALLIFFVLWGLLFIYIKNTMCRVVAERASRGKSPADKE